VFAISISLISEKEFENTPRRENENFGIRTCLFSPFLLVWQIE
jgi:hypothetical protein